MTESGPSETAEQPAATINDTVAARLRKHVTRPDLRDTQTLHRLLRMLAKWRSQMLSHVMWDHTRGMVSGGPFAGMRHIQYHSEGALAARLLGCYESELHPFIEKIIAAAYPHIAVIGCGDGYYAVGFALRCPDAAIQAFDINPEACESCRELARINNVSHRVAVAEAFTPELLGNPEKTFILCDAEGAEAELMDPEKYPVLRSVPALIIECHHGKRPGVTERIARAFTATHRVRLVDNALAAPVLPGWLRQRSHLDQLLALWEWREAPTPWLVLARK
jgi:hypothetical protein